MAKLSDADYSAIVVAMNEVRREGLAAARHIEGDLYEIRRSGQKAHYRVIFALEGRRILLALDVYDKDTQKMPLEIKRRCEQRLRDWRARS
jgi:phage-related protein